MSLETLATKLKGGSGSGNFGHSGRPGKRGGSAPRREGYSIPRISDMQQDYKAKLDDYCNQDRQGCASLTKYTSSFYVDMNEYLNKNVVGIYASKEELDRHIKNLDRLIANIPSVENNIIVKHGASSRFMGNLKVGDKFTNKGYTSATLNTKPRFGDMTLSIHVPKGSAGAYIAPKSMHPSEREFMLPRNSKFKVLSKHKNRMEVELI